MESIFSSNISWPPQSVVELTTSDGHVFMLHKAIVKHRWEMFRKDPDRAIEILRSLTYAEVRAVLLFIYSNLPAKHFLDPVFQRCELKLPKSLQESTFVPDMRELLADKSETDFELISSDGESIRAHMAVLAARSVYFRAMFCTKSLEVQNYQWKCNKELPANALSNLVEFLYTGQIAEPDICSLIPMTWAVRYLAMTSYKDAENIVISSLSRELTFETADEIAAIATKWKAKGITAIIEKFLDNKE